MEITASKINEWIQADRRRKIRADRRSQFFGGVRRTFIYLFVVAIVVFVLNHREEIQSLASAKLQHVKNSIPPDKLRQSAVNYEKQIDDIAK